MAKWTTAHPVTIMHLFELFSKHLHSDLFRSTLTVNMDESFSTQAQDSARSNRSFCLVASYV